MRLLERNLVRDEEEFPPSKWTLLKKSSQPGWLQRFLLRTRCWSKNRRGQPYDFSKKYLVISPMISRKKYKEARPSHSDSAQPRALCIRDSAQLAGSSRATGPKRAANWAGSSPAQLRRNPKASIPLIMRLRTIHLLSAADAEEETNPSIPAADPAIHERAFWTSSAMAGGRARRAAKARRLVDPVREIDIQALIDHLTKKPQVHPDELDDYRDVPGHLLNESVKVKPKNRGLRKIYSKMAHLRRRLLSLLLSGNEESLEGDYIRSKLDVFGAEVLLIQQEIRDLGGNYYELPDAFTRPVALRY